MAFTNYLPKSTKSVEDMDKKEFSSFLKEYRKYREISQIELCRKLKISKSLVCIWESERSFPSKKMLPVLNQFFKKDFAIS